KPTIVVKNIDAYNSMLGQTESFTFTDYKLINLHHCKIECYNKMECRNGGYIAIKRCSQCICPRSYYGEKCQFFKPFFNKHCMTSSLTAKEHPQLLYEEGKKICNYHIKSESGTKILLILHESNTYNRTVCTSNYGLEIKYFEDKGLTGLCLCGLYKNIKITSEKNEVYLEYYGLNANHYFYLTYIKVCEDYSIKSKICQESSCFDIKPDVTEGIGDLVFRKPNN
uniref:CUB domain-containing protein n=1 Tax=Parastrongyloides trichosuri TaxID=131310 RepID=A0A0N4Z8Y4_PARTI